MDAGLNVMLGWDPVATAPGSDMRSQPRFYLDEFSKWTQG